MTRFCLMLLGLILLAETIPVEAQTANAPATFRNPVKQDGADPWMTWYKGWYYLTSTTAVDIKMRRARRIGELKDAPDQVVWKDDTPGRTRDMWATEFHLLESGKGLRWYAYYTAADGVEPNHRMYVLESASDDPLGPYTFKAQLQTDPKNEHYAIDGTILTLPNGAYYFIWCGRPSAAGQGIYISRMTNPWTLIGSRVYLETAGFGCDFVREGPITLQRDGKVFLIYSACGADTPDYKLGLLSADAQSDLLNPASWHQHPRPVFGRVDQWSVFGPGHNFFFKSPDGKEDWIVYHAKTGTKNTFADRVARAQRFNWNPDGTPNFGLPLSPDSEILVPSGEVSR